MSILFSRPCAATLASAFLLAGGTGLAQQRAPLQGPAASQQQQPLGPIKLDLVGLQPEWTKVCANDPQTKKETCYTTRDFAAQGQLALSLAIFDPKGEDHKPIQFMLPLGLMLKPGLRFSVDKGQTESAAFEICVPAGCLGELKVRSSLIDSMKKAEKLTVVARNPTNNEVIFEVPLAGFGKAFDGAPIDPKVLEEQQKKFQEELQKKAEEERKKLEGREDGSARAPARAPAPPSK